MPILDLQQQQAQVGRIRIGHQVPSKGGKTRPEKLDRFRFTTPSEQLANAVASKYGGEVTRWTPDGRAAEWEVISTARALPVLVPPRACTQWYEMWSGAGCVRRCDGQTETLSGEPCKCPLDALQRADLAKDGKACKATTRLNVMLPELPGVGVWRLDSHGYYAAIEIPQTAAFLGAVTEAGGYVRAVLELAERQVRRPGEGVRTFLVPMLHVDVTVEQLMAGEGAVAIGGGARAAISGVALPSADRPALEAGPAADPEDIAQAYADQAKDATTRDAVMAIWDEAKTHGETVMEAEIADPEGVLVKLSAYLKERGKAFAAAAAPSGDVDVVWATIMARAGEHGLDTDTVKAAFRAWSNGTDVADATAEQLQGFLDEVYAADVEAAGAST